MSFALVEIESWMLASGMFLPLKVPRVHDDMLSCCATKKSDAKVTRPVFNRLTCSAGADQNNNSPEYLAELKAVQAEMRGTQVELAVLPARHSVTRNFPVSQVTNTTEHMCQL